MGLQVERDLWFRPTPVSQLPEYEAKWGNDGPYRGSTPAFSKHLTGESARALLAEVAAIVPEMSGIDDVQPSPSPLPDGWTVEDIAFLLEKLEGGPILVAGTELGIPTIHDTGGRIEHCGFGLMKSEGTGFTLHFDAGSAMKRTPSGKGWTRLKIEGQYAYDMEGVKATLQAYLNEKNKQLQAAPGSEAQPFSITLEQWLELPGHQTQKTGNDMRYTGEHAPRTLWAGVTGHYEAVLEQHRCEVQRAIIEGRPVTADVLNEYPDLVKKAGEKGLTCPPVDDDYRPVWMRTQREFSVSHPMSAGGVPIGKVDMHKQRYHELVVLSAVARGYPVPDRVRSNYPEEIKPVAGPHGDQELSPIEEWDKSWEDCSPTLNTTCSRCGGSPAGEGEKRWLRACGEQTYLCPKCLDALLAWKEKHIQAAKEKNQAKDKEMRRARAQARKARTEAKPPVCDNASRGPNGWKGGVSITPQCLDNLAARVVTVYYDEYMDDGEHDTMNLCDECYRILRKEARAHGYKLRSKKLSAARPKAKAEAKPKAKAKKPTIQVVEPVPPPAQAEAAAWEPTPEDEAEFKQWSLELLTGMMKKRKSAFYRALNAVARPGALRLVLIEIPAAEARRRELIEKRLAKLAA